MNNRELAEKLIAEASLLQEELTRAWKGEHWNLAVRRAQEVVELSLKGLLRAMGLEYPRQHDVGNAFAEAAADRQLGLDPEIVERLRDISAHLARERSPAFYLEREFTAAQATRAKEEAEFVLDFARKLAQRLKSE